MRRPNPDQHVDVIGDAVDDQGGSVHFTNDAAEVSEQVGAEIGLDQRAPTLCGEDHVKQDIAGSVRHVSYAPPGLGHFSLSHPRLAPWAAIFRRFRGSLSNGSSNPYASDVFEGCDGCHIGLFLLPRRTKMVIPCIFQIPPCNFSFSSSINHPPRADVWLSRFLFATLVCVRHLSKCEGGKALKSSRPRDLIRKHW